MAPAWVRRGVWLGLLGLVLVAAVGGHRFWCVRQVQVPIFDREALSGDATPVIVELGEPEEHRSVTVAELKSDETLRRLFRHEEIEQLPPVEMELWQWRQRCFGSIVWNFALVSE